MKTVGCIFNNRTFRLDGLIIDDWVAVYFGDLKKPRRFRSIEDAVLYAYKQALNLTTPQPEYFPTERWWPLDEEDWAEVSYRLAQLEREGGDAGDALEG